MSSNSMQQQRPQQPAGAPGLNPGVNSFVPQGPVDPNPVDLMGQSTVARVHGVYSFEA